MEEATILHVPRRPKSTGEYRESGKVIEAWLDAHREFDRKAFAQKLGVTPAAVGHWILGHSWPSKPAYRGAMRNLGVDVGEIDRAVCSVLALNPFDAEERELLAAWNSGDEELRDRIRAAIKPKRRVKG